MNGKDLAGSISRIEERLDTLDQKMDALLVVKRKSMEWIAQMSEQVQSLDAFREEVRASLEPMFDKLRNIDEVVRIMRHATVDVSRRVEEMENGKDRMAG